jgi:Lar family restriction alleviation protein
MIGTVLKLKACPFCSCKAVELEEATDGNGLLLYAQVECPACLARGPQETVMQNAINFWNDCEVAGRR